MLRSATSTSRCLPLDVCAGGRRSRARANPVTSVGALNRARSTAPHTRTQPPRGSPATLPGVSKNGTGTAAESLPAILQGIAAKHWHDIAMEVSVRDYTRFGGPEAEPPIQQPGPCYTTRAMTIVHIAMYDAFMTLTGDNEPYGSYSDIPAFTGDELVRASYSAVAGAAVTALCDVHSEQADFVHRAAAAFDAHYGTVPKAKKWGERVAAQLLQERADDGFDTCLPVTEFDDPVDTSDFKHQPDPVMLEGGAGQQKLYAKHWRYVRPWGFALPVREVIAPLPDPLETFDYPADFEKVADLGDENSSTRTDKQTETGIFWAYDGEVNIGTPHRLFSEVIDAAVAAKGVRGGAALLCLYAATNVAMADGAIQAWEEKYRWNFWRPVVAVRAGSDDPETHGIDGWKPLGAPKSNTNKPKYSPNFPAYPSGHATIGTAGMRTAEALLGLPKDFEFEFLSAEFDGTNSDRVGAPPRPRKPRWLTIDKAVNQNQNSRVFLGVHWTFDSSQGAVAGQDIADKIVANFPERASD